MRSRAGKVGGSGAIKIEKLKQKVRVRAISMGNILSTTTTVFEFLCDERRRQQEHEGGEK